MAHAERPYVHTQSDLTYTQMGGIHILLRLLIPYLLFKLV